MRLIVAFLVLVAFDRPSLGQPSKDDVAKAAALFEQGKRHFDLAEYSDAIASFRAAYRLSSEPLLVFNIAQSYRLSGDCAQANRFYLKYKELVRKPTNQVELDAAMQKCVGVAPADGDSTDVKPADPPAKPVEPLPSKPIEPLPPPPLVDAPPGRGLRIAGVVTAGVGVLAGIYAVKLAFDARRDADEISNAMDVTWADPFEAIQSHGRSAQFRSRVFAGVGVAAIATGSVMWWLGRSRSLHVVATLSSSGGKVSMTCAF